MRRPAAIALLTTIVLLLPTAALAAPEWRSAQDGAWWDTCAPVTLRPNDSGATADSDLRRDVAMEVSAVNAAAGRTVLRVGADTDTETRDTSDADHVVHVGETGWPDRGRPLDLRLATGGGSITGADLLVDRDWLATADRTARRHEFRVVLLHLLGFGAVGDAHEILSPAHRGDPLALGPGTRDGLRRVYGTGADCDAPPRVPGSVAWDAPAFPAALDLRLTEVGTADDVINVGFGVLFHANNHRGEDWARIAVICRDDVYADCLAGASLTGADGPVLFVPGGGDGSLNGYEDLVDELDRALRPDAPVYILGGPNAVSERIESQLASRWSKVRRLAGRNRIETAVDVAREVVRRHPSWDRTAVLARADAPEDAVTAGAAAGERALPLLLTYPDDLHPATRAALADLRVRRTLAIGGERAITPSVIRALNRDGRRADRVGGRTRAETAVAIARHPRLWDRRATSREMAFSGLPGWSPLTWALALAAAPEAAWLDAPLLLTRDADVPLGPPAGRTPGETGWYLAHLPPPGDAGTVRIDYHYYGSTLVDPYAVDSFTGYLGIGSR